MNFQSAPVLHLQLPTWYFLLGLQDPLIYLPHIKIKKVQGGSVALPNSLNQKGRDRMADTSIF